MRILGRLASIIVLCISLAGPLSAGSSADAHWVTAWGSAQQVPEPHNALPTNALADATLRQTVRMRLGGEKLRVRLSNAFGTSPLVIGAAAAARAKASGSAGIVPEGGRPLLFGGRVSVTIPAGAEYLSDPLDFVTAPGEDLAISVYFPEAPKGQTGHPGSRTTSWYTTGNQVMDAELAAATPVVHWYQLADVEVQVPKDGRALVAIGDSITDGYGTTTDGNDRWPDHLARRLAADPKTADVAVVNLGIGGNRVLRDGLGPNLLARFDRDVINRAGVSHVFLLEGVNDLGTLTANGPVDAAAHRALVADIEAGFRELARRAHEKGIRVIGGTIMPFTGSFYKPDAATEADRVAINKFIRTSGIFDAVVDLDRITADPKDPTRLAPAFDSGDHLHPSLAGYKAMADAFPVDLLAPVAPLRIALTFDDMPAHGDLPPGVTRADVTRRIVAALGAVGAPAHGFVNGGFDADTPDGKAALAVWRAAGLPIGNHTYSHPHLSGMPLRAFEADILRNEAYLKRELARGDAKYFRFPFLDEGETLEKRAAIRTWLADHEYKVAEVTMSFNDFAWNASYARCVAKGDAGSAARLEAGFLAAAKEALALSRSSARAAFGRDIPHVLLLHVGALDAEMLPRLLADYKAEGATFVTLDEAEADPAYAAPAGIPLATPAIPVGLDRLCP